MDRLGLRPEKGNAQGLVQASTKRRVQPRLPAWMRRVTLDRIFRPIAGVARRTADLGPLEARQRHDRPVLAPRPEAPRRFTRLTWLSCRR